MRQFLKTLLPPRLWRSLARFYATWIGHYAAKSYAQEGEDILMSRFLSGRALGFYVDVGAHHPHRFSNTFLFYKRGWKGINIEPNPDAVRLFRSARPRDLTFEMGVSETNGELSYYMFDESALNTFDADVLSSRLEETPYRHVGTRPVPVLRLDQILDEHLPRGQKIDFLTVDVEGLDLAVLKSNNWQAYRPEFVLAEALDTPLERIRDSEIYSFMADQNYELLAKTYNTLVFRDKTT